MSSDQFGPIFVEGGARVMVETITELEAATQTLNQPSPWSDDAKVSDDFLDPLFEAFFAKIGISNLMRKSDYHQLAKYLTPEEIDSEVTEVLDGIVDVARQARGEEPPT